MSSFNKKKLLHLKLYAQQYEGKEPKKQFWTPYNLAKQNEKPLFLDMLRELVEFLPEIKPAHTGRPGMDVKEMIFSMCVAIYCGKSSRRSVSELKLSKKMGFIKKVPHFNTLLKYFRRADMTVLLQHLIVISALPLRHLERDFTVDASGFSTDQYGRWYDHKYGKEKDRREWVKMHVMSAVKTNVITSVEITKSNVGDTKMFPQLLQETNKYFKILEVSADKAYLSRKNYSLVHGIGATPYIPFKINSSGTPRGAPWIWRKMYDLFTYQPLEYFPKYHKRSNAETVFGNLKQKFNSRVRNKTLAGRINELLSMCLAHNLLVLIQEIFELGINVDFSLCAEHKMLKSKL